MKNSILITHENCDGSLASTTKTNYFKETIKNGRLETPMAFARAKLRRAITIVGVVHPMESTTKLACVLEAHEFSRLRMGGKETIHDSIIIWFTNLFFFFLERR